MVPLLIAIGALVLSAATFLYVWRVAVVFLGRFKALEGRYEDGFDSVWKRDQEHKLLLMDSLITEGLLHAKRREERARGVVRGALKRLDEAGVEDASVEAEADELGVGTGEDGIGEWMPNVPDLTGIPPEDTAESPIPGLSYAEYQTLLGERAN